MAAAAGAQGYGGQERSALSRLLIEGSSISAEGRDRGRPRPLEFSLSLSQPVPYRLFLLDSPPRLVVDFAQVDFAGAEPDALAGNDLLGALRWGNFRPGWSRMVAELPGPYAVESAAQTTGDAPRLTIRLRPVRAEDFAPRGNALSALWDLPEPSAPPRRPPPEGALHVVLDPGHGGIDSGAIAAGVREADLMLSFARELRDKLLREGLEVTLTRSEDVFVGLEARMTAARAAGADLFISLHADALPAGQAAGTAIYVWDQNSDDTAARQLAERHDRADLLAGLDLQGTDDSIALTLMQLARTDTQPRSENIAAFLRSSFGQAGINMHRQPVKGAAFSVLKSPDIPSVLIELGFLTDPVDRENLLDTGWRANMAGAIADAVTDWASDDRTRRSLLRH
ncbi:MAG: N-acetylmuramoyl-L-alanine amidase [Paracoccus sp. (in: a-proteobacteria)]|nr:N-acetylmuramoyl-L-alanine amidase [Paracoccus sp. (in: a-proteobacteria)]